MGEISDYHVDMYSSGAWGMRETRKRNQIIRINCPYCAKEVHGKAALMQHEKAKHGIRYNHQVIERARNNELFGKTELLQEMQQLVGNADILNKE